MKQLSLILLGPLQVTRNGEAVTGFESDKVRALLVYLVIATGRPHRRDALAELLWPEREPGIARNSFKQALANLRKVLGDRGAERPFLHITRHNIQFNSDSNHRLDTALFGELLEACDNHRHRHLATCNSCRQRLHEIAALYRGDFLEGFYLADSPAFEEWLLVRREGYRRQLVVAIAALVEYHERRDEYERALPLARRQVALEPWDEAAHRRLMRLLALNGQRSAALKQYQDCERALAKELSLEPTDETMALYKQIQELQSGEEARIGRFKPPLTQRHNLPPQATPFIGRQAELDTIEERLEDPNCRLLTLVGPGGIGKTRLALQAAAVNIGGYDDGVYFVPLAPVSAAEFMLPAIADVLQITLSGANPRRRFLNHLRHKELLLLLDNFEHLLGEDAGATALLAEITRTAPAVKLLITSRERLHLQGERIVEVQGMRYPEIDGEDSDLQAYSAIQLFIACAQRAYPDFSPELSAMPDVMRICRAVDGMPLGIELTAAWVRVLPLADIASEIDGNFDLLATSLTDVPARHRSLQAVFEHSWKLLTPQEQTVFRRLSVFRGGCRRDAATQVAGATIHILTSLVDKSLLQYAGGGGRYQIHELLRQFGARKLSQDAGKREETRDRHAHFYTHFLHNQEANLKGDRQEQALAAIEQEIDNIRAGWRWAVARGNKEQIERGLEALQEFYGIRGWNQEAVEIFGQAVTICKKDSPGCVENLVVGKLLAYQGEAYWLLGQNIEARKLLLESLAILKRSADQVILARVHRRLGNVLTNLGAAREGNHYHRKSLSISRESGDKWGTQLTLNELGVNYMALGDYGEATRCYQENMVLAREIGNERGIAWALIGLGGHVALPQGEYEQAEAYLQEGLTIARGIGGQWAISYSLELLGWIAIAHGEYEQAGRLLQESLALSNEMADQLGIGLATVALAKIALALAEYVEAERLLHKSKALFSECGNLRRVALSLNTLGEVALAQGAQQQAKAHMQEALAIYQEIEDPTGIMWASIGLGEAACALQEAQTAQEYFRTGLKLGLEMGLTPAVMAALTGMSALLSVEGKPEEAIALLAHPLRHPTGSQATKDRATRLLDELAVSMPAEVVAKLLKLGGGVRLENVVTA